MMVHAIIPATWEVQIGELQIKASLGKKISKTLICRSQKIMFWDQPEQNL
jgi:hypothetical protein